MRAFCLRFVGVTAFIVVGVAQPTAASGQFPGDLRVVVVDAATGRPVRDAEVRTALGGGRALTDPSGGATLSALESGPHTIRTTALGYHADERVVTIADGRIARLTIELRPDPVSLPGITASLRALETGTVLTREEIRESGSGTVASLLQSVPSVVVLSRGRGSAQTASIRGSAEDAVLVLLDGVPLNDPMTGEADLALVPVSRLSRVVVLPGARSVRFGAGAQAGVILLETGRDESELAVGIGSGSLGHFEVDARTSSRIGGGAATADVGLRSLDGGFDFERPSEVGGGDAERVNADQRSVAAAVGWQGSADGADVSVRLRGEWLRRGLPGRSFAPSRTARQHLRRAAASASWRAPTEDEGPQRASAFLRWQSVRFDDPDPPFGDPFDDTSRFLDYGATLDWLLLRGGGLSMDAGVHLQHQAIRSDALAEDAPRGRTDGATRFSGAWSATPKLQLTWGGRLHRDGLRDEWLTSHDLGATYAPFDRLRLRAAHRSSFSPPSLGDQFFREGVGVEPNAELEAERVPSEWVAGARLSGGRAGISAQIEVEAYRGDVRGLILWQPDFRFVWSPRNTDVSRRGVDISAGIESPRVRANGHISLNRTTYDRPGEPVQVVYRPRVSGALELALDIGGMSIGLRPVYTGARFPVPNAVNELPGFWTVDLTLDATRAVAGTTLELRASITRLLDAKDTLIFGFPDPGRTLSVSLRARR